MSQQTSLYWPDWLTVAIAVVALVQPGFVALWNKYLRKPTVEVYETRTIEVGYSGFGATVGLVGTLQALHRDAFGRRASVVVVRRKDRAEQRLNWRAFRPQTVAVGGGAAPTLELASSFLLTVAGPFRYNIFFASDEFTGHHQPGANAVIERWYGFVRDKLKEVDPEWTGQAAAALQDPALSEALFREFLKSKEPSDLHNSLNDEFVWHAGDYDLHLTVECSRPTQAFRKSWMFWVSERDASQLRVNAMGVLRELCGFQPFYHFAYPEYQHNGFADATSPVA